jgi:hypothetical protein
MLSANFSETEREILKDGLGLKTNQIIAFKT